MKRSFKIFSFVIILTLIATPVFAANTFTGVSLPVPASFNSGYILGIWGASASDIHVVGYGNDGSADLPITYRYDGNAWTANSPALPGGWSSGNLRSVWGSNSTNVYAVGFGSLSGIYTPLMYHFDGSNWTQVPITVPSGWTYTYLDGIWGLSANNIYAIGYGYNGSNYTPLIYHFDGSNWISAAPAMPSGWDFGALYNAWGSDPNDVYAVGSGYDGAKISTLLYHFDGVNWTSSSPDIPNGWSYGFLWGIWGSGANDIHAFGGGTEAGIDLPLIYYFDGIAWTYTSPALPSGWNYGYLYDGWGASSNDIYAVGYGYNNAWEAFPLLYHFDGINWTEVSLTLPDGIMQGQIWSTHGFAANNIYAAGFGYDGSITMPLIYHGVDVTPPVVTVPADITAEATSASGATVSFSVSATDDTIPANPAVTCSPASGSIFPLDVTTNVDCWATDDAGNTGHGYFNITVVDTTPPTLNISDITVPQTIPGGAVANYTASATDLVDGPVAINCVPASGSTFPIGTTTVNCSATDAHNNTANGTFNVTVTGQNLLKKPDFSSASVFPTPWQAFGFKPPYTVALDCSYYNFGPCSVLFPSGNRSAMQRLVRSGVTGDTYFFGMYSAAQNVPAGGKYLVEVGFYNNLNRLVGLSQLQFNAGTHGFELVSGSATATGNYNRIFFRFYYQNSGGRAWFDDAFLYFLGNTP